MKIAILGAMDQEVALLKASLENVTVSEYAHLNFYSGQMHGVDVVVVKCGIGKVASSVATTVLIDMFAPDFVVNTGSAGGFDSDLSIGDLVIGTSVQHHDVDVTHFGDRKSTRLNSSHANISYAVFCLKKKTRLQHTSSYR